MHTVVEKGAATVALAKPCPSSVNGTSEPRLEAPFLRADGAQIEATALDCRAWFAVFTTSHHEKKVSQRFVQQRIENYLPLYSQVHKWTNRRRVTVQLPLFPNYVFVRVDRGQRGQVLQVPGVLAIVGRGYEPTPLPDFEIESLRSGLHLRKFEPHPTLVEGTRVRIRVGPLDGMEGFLLRKKNNLRVVLTVPLINKSLAVEVDATDIEPLSWQNPADSSHPRAVSALIHTNRGN
jgi:transcription antitermination factor NusG